MVSINTTEERLGAQTEHYSMFDVRKCPEKSTEVCGVLSFMPYLIKRTNEEVFFYLIDSFDFNNNNFLN